MIPPPDIKTSLLEITAHFEEWNQLLKDKSTQPPKRDLTSLIALSTLTVFAGIGALFFRYKRDVNVLTLITTVALVILYALYKRSSSPQQKNHSIIQKHFDTALQGLRQQWNHKSTLLCEDLNSKPPTQGDRSAQPMFDLIAKNSNDYNDHLYRDEWIREHFPVTADNIIAAQVEQKELLKITSTLSKTLTNRATTAPDLHSELQKGLQALREEIHRFTYGREDETNPYVNWWYEQVRHNVGWWKLQSAPWDAPFLLKINFVQTKA